MKNLKSLGSYVHVMQNLPGMELETIAVCDKKNLSVQVAFPHFKMKAI